MEIVSTGMVCPVGHTADAACAAIRAGVAGFSALPYQSDTYEPIIGAAVPWIDLALPTAERLARMLALSVAECLAAGPPGFSAEAVPLILGIAEAGRPGGSRIAGPALISSVEQLLETRFHPRLSCAIATGHTSTFEALMLARQYMRERGIEACLVCGVDSYVNAPSLLWLAETLRLKCDANSDGVIPGEAAAALLLRSEAAMPRGVRIAGLGLGHEAAGVLGQEPLLGHGLAQAARTALADAQRGLQDVAFRVSDATGESYAFKEQALMLARVLRSRREDFPLWHCADSLGDTGAAAGACGLVCAHRAFVRRYAPGSSALCFASGVQGPRAAALLEY